MSLASRLRLIGAVWGIGDVMIGAVAIRRPEVIRRALGSTQSDRFLALWGARVCTVGVTQTLACADGSRSAMRALALLRAAAIPGDLIAGEDAQPTPSYLRIGTVVNATTAILAVLGGRAEGGDNSDPGKKDLNG